MQIFSENSLLVHCLCLRVFYWTTIKYSNIVIVFGSTVLAVIPPFFKHRWWLCAHWLKQLTPYQLVSSVAKTCRAWFIKSTISMIRRYKRFGEDKCASESFKAKLSKPVITISMKICFICLVSIIVLFNSYLIRPTSRPPWRADLTHTSRRSTWRTKKCRWYKLYLHCFWIRDIIEDIMLSKQVWKPRLPLW